MTDPAARYLRRPDLRAVEMDGELVMMGQEQGEYYSLKDVAASLWQHLSEPRTVSELSDLVASEYEIEASDCRADIEAFVDELLGKDLIRTA